MVSLGFKISFTEYKLFLRTLLFKETFLEEKIVKGDLVIFHIFLWVTLIEKSLIGIEFVSSVILVNDFIYQVNKLIISFIPQILKVNYVN